MNERSLDCKAALARYPGYDEARVAQAYGQALKKRPGKVVVLDDDPTGIQTVHDVMVYTDWTVDSMRQGFAAKEPIFFILTNSRGFSREETTQAHREIARNLAQVSGETGQGFILISRSDSTLRGHYPLETETLRDELEALGFGPYDGEIIVPFFQQGGRYTLEDVHYLQVGDELVPAGMTEFAKDRTFGYESSNLREWVCEKTEGRYRAQDVVSVTLSQLRGGALAQIEENLLGVQGFGKVIVNAIDEKDVQMFVVAFLEAMGRGKQFIFRSAATLTKVIGGIGDKPLLTRQELVNTQNRNGGLIVVGSHVRKTTLQLEALKREPEIEFIEFHARAALDDGALAREQRRVIGEVERHIRAGRTVAVYTSRDRLDLGEGKQEEELLLSVKISQAVSGVVAKLAVRPNFVIAKGGITSSDVGTQGLGVKRALVMGQILSGIPVWLTGEESKFPGMPYVIFPGNVGDENALRDAYRKIRPSGIEEKEGNRA